jgi:methenyltetrahydromethanopterin cyclohydrolase
MTPPPDRPPAPAEGRGSPALHLNDGAARLVADMAAAAEILSIAVSTLPNGATVVDAGVAVPGSLQAGRLFAAACLGGLADIQFRQLDIGGLPLPGVEVEVRQPVIACMASQYAGWAVDVPATESSTRYSAMGSGPARALRGREPIFETVEYRDSADQAVLALETRRLPGAAVAEWIAGKCGVSPDRLSLLVAPTASLVGSVQIAARIVETGLHKLHEVGFDLATVRSGFGSCPLAPVAGGDLAAIGRTNDAVLYGGRAWYTVETDDAQIERVIDSLPSCGSRDYGVPFGELFERYDRDFYRIDPLLFSPAEITITNSAGGATFRAGHVDRSILERALFT